MYIEAAIKLIKRNPPQSPIFLVADSKTIRLPTLKELIGYPTTYYYDNHIATTPSSALLHLLRNDVDNDINQQNVEEISFQGTNESQSGEREQSARDIIGEETGDWWLRQASENKARSRTSKKIDIALDEAQNTDTPVIREDEDGRKEYSTSIYLRPTTMRGIPLASLTSSPLIRGFYVTKSEDDLPSSTLAVDFTSPYTTIDSSIELADRSQTETASTLDISTTEETISLIRNNLNKSEFNDNLNDIVTDEVVTRNELELDSFNDNVSDIIKTKGDNHEEKSSTFDSSIIFSENFNSTENSSTEPTITIPIGKSIDNKREISLRNFDYNSTSLSDVHAVSPTTSAKRKIAIALNRYNKASTPLWTGKRIVPRKRNRTAVSSKGAERRIDEATFAHITTDIFKNASATSTLISAKDELVATSTVPTVPLIVSESTMPAEMSDVYSHVANSTNSTLQTENPRDRINTEATITLLTNINSITAATPQIAEITSITNDSTVISTISGDFTSVPTMPSTANESIVVVTPSIVAIATAPVVANDQAAIMTKSMIKSAAIEIPISMTTNYSVTAVPTIVNDSEITPATIGVEITFPIANYSNDFANMITAATINSEVKTTSAITNYSATAIPTNAMVTDPVGTTAPVITINTGLETNTVTDPIVTISTATNTQEIVTDPTIITTSATTGTEVETTITNHPVVNPATTMIPTTSTLSSTVISSTHVSVPKTSNIADADTVNITNISTTVITPTISDLNLITSANINEPSIFASTDTSTITSLPKTDSVISSKDFLASTDEISPSSAMPTTLTIESTTATTGTEVETTIINHSAVVIPATTVIPTTSSLSSTVISSTHVTVPKTSNIADADNVNINANMSTMNISTTVIPIISDLNLITSANTNDPSTFASTDTSTITSLPKTDSVISSKDFVASTDETSPSSAVPTTLTIESTTATTDTEVETTIVNHPAVAIPATTMIPTTNTLSSTVISSTHITVPKTSNITDADNVNITNKSTTVITPTISDLNLITSANTNDPSTFASTDTSTITSLPKTDSVISSKDFVASTDETSPSSAVPTTLTIESTTATTDTEVETTIINHPAVVIPATTMSPTTSTLPSTVISSTHVTVPKTSNITDADNVNITNISTTVITPTISDLNLITSANTNDPSTFASTDTSTITSLPKTDSVISSKDFLASTDEISPSSAVPTTLTIESTTATTDTEVETTIINHPAVVIPATTMSPTTSTLPSTVISSTHVTVPKTSNIADADNVNITNMSTTNISTTVITPTISDLNLTTSANTNDPSTFASTDTSTITSLPKTDSVISPKDFVASTDETSPSSAVPTTLTIESTTAHFNSNVFNISNNSEVSVITAKSVQTAEIPATFETFPIFTSTTISRSLPSTNSASTTAFPDQTSENFVTSTITQTPSTSFSIVTPDTNTATVEKSIYSKSIATNTIIQTTDIYKPSSVRPTSEKPPKIKINNFEETASKTIQNREDKTSNLDDQFSQKSTRRRVVNRTNNWIGRPVVQQTINQYPPHRVYHEGSRRPPGYTSKVIEENRRRRIIQRRMRIEPISSTTRPDESIIVVQNTTENHVPHDRTRYARKRMRIVSRRVRERPEEITTLRETTSLSQPTVTDNKNKTIHHEKVHHENANVERKRKLLLRRTKLQSQENLRADETSADFDSVNKNLTSNFQSNFRMSRNLFEQKNKRRRMRVVLKNIRPKPEEKNPIEGDPDFIDKKFQGNFSTNFHANRNFSDKGRRTRVLLKRVRPISKEYNTTIEETNVNVIDKNLQNNLSNNPSTSENFPDEKKIRRGMRVVLKRIRPKFEEEKAKTEEANADVDSTNENLRGALLRNFRGGKKFPIEHKTGRTRVVLKNVRPKFEENHSRARKTDSDSINKDLRGSFSNNFYTNVDFSNEEKTRKSKFEEKDLIAEENVRFDFTDKNVLNNFSNREKIVTYFKDEKKEATVERLEDIEEQQTTETFVLAEEDTDQPSLEINSSKNAGSVDRKSGHAIRHRRPSTTVAPLINTFPSTVVIYRNGRPIETTFSSRVDLVDAFVDTGSTVDRQDDQKPDVSDQSTRAQEFAVTLADPPLSSSSSDTGRTTLGDAARRKISTTIAPRTDPNTIDRMISRYDADFRNRQRPKTKSARPIVNTTTRPRRPVLDYDYYEDDVPIVSGKSFLNSKLFLTSKGTIRCLDQGNFPHPYSCKKFITCTRMVNSQIIGTEYTCPDRLTFDPVGGICNWSAGLGCND